MQYVLEGSVQMAGDRVRVTAQLIDALKGHHLWSERYDRSLKDLFELQDEISMKILTELRVTITGGLRTRIKGNGQSSGLLEEFGGDWERQIKAPKRANAEAKRLFQEAIALDPNWATPYAGLANSLYMDLFFGASESPKETLSNAMNLAHKAVELDNSSAEAHAVLSEIFLGMRQHDKAIEAGERAVTLDPNDFGLSLIWPVLCSTPGGARRAFLSVDRPFDSILFVRSLPLFALACRETGRYEEGIAAP